MELQIGQYVRITSTGSTGTVYKFSDMDRVIVRVGKFATMFVTVPVDDVEDILK